MKTVDQMLNQVQNLNLQDIAQKSVKKTLPQLEQANRDQMLDGQNAKEQPITPYYKPSTVAIKKRKGQETRWVTLKDKGHFHRGIEADVSGENYLLNGTDDLTPLLKKKYGEEIFGVGGKYQEKYVEGALSEATYNELENHFK